MNSSRVFFGLKLALGMKGTLLLGLRVVDSQKCGQVDGVNNADQEYAG
jgi:hypothetical protein